MRLVSSACALGFCKCTVSDLRKVMGLNRCDSFMKLSSLISRLRACLVHPPSSARTFSISSRSGAIYSRRAQRSYRICVGTEELVRTAAKLMASAVYAIKSGVLSGPCAASHSICKRSIGGLYLSLSCFCFSSRDLIRGTIIRRDISPCWRTLVISGIQYWANGRKEG